MKIIQKLVILILCIILLTYGCTDNSDNIIYSAEFGIIGRQEIFRLQHVDNNPGFSLLLNPEEFKNYIIKNKKYLYEREFDNNLCYFFEDYGVIFAIKSKGLNSENSNLYDYELIDQNIYIGERVSKINQETGKEFKGLYNRGYIIFPVIYTLHTGFETKKAYPLSELNCDFSMIKEFYEKNAVIEGNTITVPVYDDMLLQYKPEVVYDSAIITYDGTDSIEFSLK